ncbi:MAG TPA: hypothetical protein VMN36_08470 [Verrucomicrobiales bacterium]|nr:hypothetical protein [Verrucomicrobiales bacterium]
MRFADAGSLDRPVRLLRLALLSENWALGLRLTRSLSSSTAARVRIRCAEFHLEYTRALAAAGLPARAREQLRSACDFWAPASFAALTDPILRELLRD